MCAVYPSIHTHTYIYPFGERGREKVYWVESKEHLEFGLLSICLKGREAWKKDLYGL